MAGENIGKLGFAQAQSPGEGTPVTAGDSLTALFSRALGEDLFQQALQRKAQEAIIQDLGLAQFLAQSGIRPGQAPGVGAAAGAIDSARSTGPTPGGAEDVLASRLVNAQTTSAILEEMRRIAELSKPSQFDKIAGPLLGLAGMGIGSAFGAPLIGASAGNLFGQLLSAGGY